MRLRAALGSCTCRGTAVLRVFRSRLLSRYPKPPAARRRCSSHPRGDHSYRPLVHSHTPLAAVLSPSGESRTKSCHRDTMGPKHIRYGIRDGATTAVVSAATAVTRAYIHPSVASISGTDLSGQMDAQLSCLLTSRLTHVGVQNHYASFRHSCSSYCDKNIPAEHYKTAIVMAARNTGIRLSLKPPSNSLINSPTSTLRCGIRISRCLGHGPMTSRSVLRSRTLMHVLMSPRLC